MPSDTTTCQFDCLAQANTADVINCFAIPIGLALFFTIIVALIVVQNTADTRIRSVVSNFPFWLYFLLMATGNSAATLVAFQYTQDMPMSQAFWAAFFGVFAFEQIISKINIGIGGEGILKLGHYIQTAQDNAVAAAIRFDAKYFD